MVNWEKDEELSLFLEMRRKEKDQEAIPLGGNIGNVVDAQSKMLLLQVTRKTAADKFLDSENGKSDYDWLITPPGTPLVEMSSQKSIVNKIISNSRSNALQVKLLNVQEEAPLKDNIPLKSRALSNKTNCAHNGNRRNSTSGEPIMKAKLRQANPPSLPSSPLSFKSSRSSTSTPRPSLPSTKPIIHARSSTPTRTIPRSSTPTSRSSKATSRSATPTRQQPNQTAASSLRVNPVPKSASSTPRISSATSLSVKSRPQNPDELPGFSLEPPPNLKINVPERSSSATKTRSRGTNNHSSLETRPNVRSRRQSCSPARGRSAVPIKTRVTNTDDVNPVLMGTKMVERVVNMRKLPPPKQEDPPTHSMSAGKLSAEATGFGRTLSRISLDMALRHMDIRRNIAPNVRSTITHLPTSSIYSVRSGGKIGGLNSPHATRSVTSSESSEREDSHLLEMAQNE